MRLALLSLSLGTCGCALEPEPLPPLGQVVLRVDTELPVPELAGRLRVDLYDSSGNWFETRELATPNADQWPMSFGLYVEQAEQREVWVRLRAYPQGKTREYRGERSTDSPEVIPSDEAPRLLRDGVDSTPSMEPEPLVTVDRLLLLQIPVEQKMYAGVVLGGNCAGTTSRLAHLAGKGPVQAEAETCIEGSPMRATVEPLVLAEEPISGGSLQGTWASDPCELPTDGLRLCVPQGAMILGNRALLMQDYIDASPERLVALGKFWIDPSEVTVGEFREMMQKGFVPLELPVANDGPLGDHPGGTCTYTSSPGDREDYGLNCVTWETARAYCRFQGGDLPTEAQWEYVATQAGHRFKMPFPWGEEEPSCDKVLFGRATLAGYEGYCEARGTGPAPHRVDDSGDVSPLGVTLLAGGLSEWCRDSWASYDDACWSKGVEDPRCILTEEETHSIRGGSWGAPMPTLVGTYRLGRPGNEAYDQVGFRCVGP